MHLPHPYLRSRLADHVRACRVGDQVILLDLDRSKYIGVSGPQLPALSELVSGWPSTNSDNAAPTEAANLAQCADPWLAHLRQERLLSDLAGPLPQAPVLPVASASLNADESDNPIASEWKQLFRLWRVSMMSALLLRHNSLADIAQRVTGLRPKAPRQPAEENRIHDAVGAYLRLRPFALTAHDRCLNDSLSLIMFLAAERIYPRWVIGVRTHPFGAHSWVQQGEIVLNDQHERVRRYEPILVV